MDAGTTERMAAVFIDKNKKFELSSPYFENMHKDLDAHISRALAIMDRKDMSGAKIGLVIDITTDRKKVNDDNAPLGVREAIMPHVGYKLTFKLEAKSESKDDIVGAGNEVIRDDIGDYFIVSTEEASGQLNLFNGYAEVDGEFPEENDEEDE